MRELVGVSTPLLWSGLIEELREARLLSSEVNGEPWWFHPQRRRFVLAECMSAAERDEGAAAAATLIWQSLAPVDVARVTEYAALVELSPSLQRADPLVGAAVRLEGESLAVAGRHGECDDRRQRPAAAPECSRR